LLEGVFCDRKKDGYRTSRINLLFSAIPYLTGLVDAYKNGDSDILAKIPTLVGERSEISNLLREDIEQLTKTI
jgi:hypothetical protein